MCRWLAYSGSPLSLETLLFLPTHSLVVQSLSSELGAEPTNGDGFGVGWYSDDPEPGLFRSAEPAWNDRNLRELSRHITSGRVFAHIRAAIGSPVQQTNCHPFRHGRWLFVHNGYVADFEVLRRDLMFAIDPALFAQVKGSTDTEVVFHLALSLGLEEDPIGALERTVGLIEATAERLGATKQVQGSFGVSDGSTLWAVRYATDGPARSLFASSDADAIKHLYRTNPRFARLTPEDRLVVSEPFSDLPGVWDEIPASSAVTVRRGGELEHRAFRPEPAAAAHA